MKIHLSPAVGHPGSAQRVTGEQPFHKGLYVSHMKIFLLNLNNNIQQL